MVKKMKVEFCSAQFRLQIGEMSLQSGSRRLQKRKRSDRVKDSIRKERTSRIIGTIQDRGIASTST